jgi:hypothetical protein
LLGVLVHLHLQTQVAPEGGLDQSAMQVASILHFGKQQASNMVSSSTSNADGGFSHLLSGQKCNWALRMFSRDITSL